MVRLTLLLALAGCALRIPEAPRGPSFKVMTFNVNYGGPGAGITLEAIRREAPDLLLLQETTPAWERFLRAGLADLYPHARFHHEGGAGGLGMFSRWPFREVSLTPSPVDWFPASIVEAETPLGALQIMNLHLHPACNENGSFTPYAFVSGSPEVRFTEIQHFHARLQPGRPTIVLGDFNEGDDGRSVRWLRERGFTDALHEFDWKTETWRWQTSVGLTLQSRLDHILYTRDFHCCEARVLKAGASDHYPVVAVFERR